MKDSFYLPARNTERRKTTNEISSDFGGDILLISTFKFHNSGKVKRHQKSTCNDILLHLVNGWANIQFIDIIYFEISKTLIFYCDYVLRRRSTCKRLHTYHLARLELGNNSFCRCNHLAGNSSFLSCCKCKSHTSQSTAHNILTPASSLSCGKFRIEKYT